MAFVEIKNRASKLLKLEDYKNITTSAWEEYPKNTDCINELFDIEMYKKNPQLILVGFKNLSESEQNSLINTIKTWLSETHVSDLDESTTELRDFIYEMF